VLLPDADRLVMNARQQRLLVERRTVPQLHVFWNAVREMFGADPLYASAGRELPSLQKRGPSLLAQVDALSGAGHSQLQIARLLGVSQAHVSRLRRRAKR
jgi:hypothetical protein